MRTYKRPLAFAATCIPALLGVSLMAGIQPAAAATADRSDCGATSTGSDGRLDASQLRSCLLAQVESSLTPADRPASDAEASPFHTDVLSADIIGADVPVAEVAGPVAEAAAPDDSGLGGAFAALRDCESGGDYGTNTGNGYYGAYQFSLSTWQSLGYGGYPDEASPAVQDQAASELQSLYGWGQWPGCSWYLGLG